MLVLRRVFAPLAELTELMRRVDPKQPGGRIEVDRSVAEVTHLENAFNEMLDRLEQERRTSGQRALNAQERERRRLGRELHDELGQTLTGIVLLLQGLARETPPAVQPSVEQLQEAARAAVEKTRDIARGLRPQALDEFGLRARLIDARGRLRRTHRPARAPRPRRDLPPLGARTRPRDLPHRPGEPDERRPPRRGRRRRSRCSTTTMTSCSASRTTASASTPPPCTTSAASAGCASAPCSWAVALTIGPSDLGGTEVRLHSPATRA